MFKGSDPAQAYREIERNEDKNDKKTKKIVTHATVL